MKAWLGKLFGTDAALEAGAEVVKKSTAGIISGIDAAFYTKEEQIADIKEVLIKLQDQYTPRSVSRRLIAVMVCGVFCAYCLAALAVILCGLIFDLTIGPTIEALVMIADKLNIPWIILTVFTFYFGYYGWKKVKETQK